MPRSYPRQPFFQGLCLITKETDMTFEANGKTYVTDAETINLMREYRGAGNTEMLAVVFGLGISFGRITIA